MLSGGAPILEEIFSDCVEFFIGAVHCNYNSCFTDVNCLGEPLSKRRNDSKILNKQESKFEKAMSTLSITTKQFPLTNFAWFVNINRIL